ncbi:MAG TPA: hypothetical protein VK191_00040 [Symbiobacteriaceae bacterium]|nr:hypothetical protein [Symbiobacteriaceae bacterium]
MSPVTATPLSPISLSLNLGQRENQAGPLLLRANLPSTIELVGPADLQFAQITLTLTAEPLVRNLADPTWGTTLSSSAQGAQYLLARPARLTEIRVEGTTSAIKADIRELGSFRTLSDNLPEGAWTQALETDAVRIGASESGQLGALPAGAAVLLASPSQPASIAVAVGDDTPVQVFPAQMEPGGTVTSRDLTPYLAAAWQRAEGEERRVALRLTSLTDGQVTLRVTGAWSRVAETTPIEIELDPVEPTQAALPWPMAEQENLLLTGALTLRDRIRTGRRLALSGEAGAEFGVRVTPGLQVAQSLLLADANGIGEGRELSAIWLHLPALPTAPVSLTLQLFKGEGEAPRPGGRPLAELAITLPADRAAYSERAGFWFRAPFREPVQLDGAAVTQPLCLVATGPADGLLLGHRWLPADTQEGPLRQRSQVGPALVQNAALDGDWHLQRFGQRPAQWLFDLELLPSAPEWGGVVRLAFPDQPPQPVPLGGAQPQTVQTGPIALQRPPSGELAYRVESQVAGRALLAFRFYKPIYP